MPGVDAAIAANQEGDRQAEYAAVKVANIGVPHYHRIVDLEAPAEIAYRFRRVVHGNRDDLQTPVSILALKIHEARNRFAARIARGVPEIKQNYFTPVRRKGHRSEERRVGKEG